MGVVNGELGTKYERQHKCKEKKTWNKPYISYNQSWARVSSQESVKALRHLFNPHQYYDLDTRSVSLSNMLSQVYCCEILVWITLILEKQHRLLFAMIIFLSF